MSKMVRRSLRRIHLMCFTERRQPRLKNEEMTLDETTLVQWKAACNRAWEVVKIRDMEIKRLKGQIKRLEPLICEELFKVGPLGVSPIGLLKEHQEPTE